MRRFVAKADRSHYSRTDLEDLFGVQPRAAQKLIELLPSLLAGTSRLVERDALAEFLKRVHTADDLTAAFEEQRRSAAKLVRTDQPTVTLASLLPTSALKPAGLRYASPP